MKDTKCDGCDAASVAAADAEEELKTKLRDSFPLTAPYRRDRLEFALSYIAQIRKWATENLGVAQFQETGQT